MGSLPLLEAKLLVSAYYFVLLRHCCIGAALVFDFEELFSLAEEFPFAEAKAALRSASFRARSSASRRLRSCSIANLT
jgi:hypothetical protein